MSSPKVVFTYKRKRLSSCSGVGHADVCSDFSLDCQSGKHLDAPNKRSESQEKHLMHICQGKKLSATCSTPQLHSSSRFREKYPVRRSDTANKSVMLVSHELPGDTTFKTLGKYISNGESVGETGNSIGKDFCLDLDSSSAHIDDDVQRGSVSQSQEKNVDSPSIDCFLNQVEVVKGKSIAPLLTFSRRLKRKADADSTVICSEQPIREGATSIGESSSTCFASCSCKVSSNKNRLVEKSVDLKVTNNDADKTNMLCQSREKTISKETGNSPCACRRSCAENLILRDAEGRSSEVDMVVDASPITKLGAVKTSCDDACKTNERPMSDQLRGAGKTLEHKDSSASLNLFHPPPGAFIIDCNVIPESDFQEEASDIQESSSFAKNHGMIVQEEHLKSKALELFGDMRVQVVDSSNDVCTSVEAEDKLKTKCLQLLSEDTKKGLFAPASANSEICCSKTQQSAAFTSDGEKHKLNKASPILGLSLSAEPINEGQKSKHGPGMHPFQNPNVQVRDYIQNPLVHRFPDHGSANFRHKVLLESNNIRAAALRGNICIPLDKFEPCPIMWSEEELDSLWIGIRRHGRGSWHAMLLDPRLHFAPWRVARDLADQWEREQYKLLSAQHTPSSRYLKPPDAYKLDFFGTRAMGPRTAARREDVLADTQLSLGDVYTRTAQSFGISQPHKHVTMAGCRVGSGWFNNVQSSVMIRGDDASPDGPAMGLAANTSLPHWLRDPTRLSDSDPSMGAHQFVHPIPEPSVTSCGRKNMTDNKLVGLMAGEVQAPSGFDYDGSLTRKQGMTDNLIVIDSDASSEETISDDHNNVK